MNLSKYKMQRALLHGAFANQQAKREQSHPVCLHAAEKYEKVENVSSTQNDYKNNK